jgi:hypothetical protein
VGDERGRVRRIAIVALARKLLIVLWRYVTQESPDTARNTDDYLAIREGGRPFPDLGGTFTGRRSLDGAHGLAKLQWLQSLAQGRGVDRSIPTRNRRCASISL